MSRGTRKQNVPKVIIAFQPSAPGCTWPVVQSVKWLTTLTLLMAIIGPSNVANP